MFLVRQFNGNTDNAALLDQEPLPDNLVTIGDDIAVVTGPNLATPSPETLDAARAAEAETAALYADHPGIFGNPGHTLWVLFALALLLVVPGLIAARWFELEDVWLKVALIPGISIALTVIAAIVWGVDPAGPVHHRGRVGLARAGHGGRLQGSGSASRGSTGCSRASPGSSPSCSRCSPTGASRRSWGRSSWPRRRTGSIQASLAKSIAFGGEKGFDVASAPSARYLLGVVLALYVPYTLVSPFAGAFIDRYDRKVLLIRSNLFRAAVVGWRRWRSPREGMRFPTRS